jgi:hypothetical protein
VRLATPLECVTQFGYRPGTVPPIGHRDVTTPVIVDSECMASALPLLAGGGSFGTLLRIEPAALLAQSNVSVAELAEAADVSDAPPSGAAVARAMSTAPDAADAHGASSAPPPTVKSFHRVRSTSSADAHGCAGDADADTALATNGAGARLAGTSAAVSEAAAGAAAAAAATGTGTGTGAAAPLPPMELVREARFLVDSMMGRLLRWLRVLGVDTLLREEGESVGEILARSQAEGRILLTRDRKLADRRDLGRAAVFVVGSDEPRERACTHTHVPGLGARVACASTRVARAHTMLCVGALGSLRRQS